MAAVFTIDVQSENSFDAHCNEVMYLVHMNLSRRIIVKFPDNARDNTIVVIYLHAAYSSCTHCLLQKRHLSAQNFYEGF